MLQRLCTYDSLEPHTLNIRNQKQSQYFDFQFPTKIFLTKSFTKPNDLNLEIVRQGSKIYFWHGRVFNRYDQENIGGVRIILTCKNKQCSAKLVFHKKKDEKYLRPIVFNNLHHHKKYNDPEKAKKQEINQFIMHLRGEQYERFGKVPEWVRKFDITNAQGQYIVEQIYWYHNTEDETLTTLSFHNNIVRRVKQGQEKLLIFVRSPTMKQSYQQYGQTLTMQLFYQTIKKRESIGQHYAIGYFFGQDTNMRIVLLGVFILIKETKEAFKKLFEIFIETTCQNRLPKFIITDERQEIRIALSELKQENGYDYNHIYPWYHMALRIKKKLKQAQLKNGKTIMDLMCKAMQESNQVQLYSLMCQLKTQLKDHPQLFQSFSRNQQFFCYRRIPKIFCGFAISTSFGQKVLGQVNNSAVYRAHTGRLYQRLLKIQTHLKMQASKPCRIGEGLLKYCPEQINYFHDKLQQNIMHLLVQTYSESKNCKKYYLDQITIKIVESNDKQFICKFLIYYDHWQCQCMYLVLTGLPCSHLMSVILDPKHRGSLSYYINSRWIQDNQGKYRPRRGPFITNKRRRP